MLGLWNSFRGRLFILVILGMVPTLVIVLHSASEQRRVAMEYAQESVLRLASDVSKDQHLMIDMTRRMLADLSVNPAVKSLDIPECSRLFKSCFSARPFLFYTDISIVDLEGKVLSSTIPLSDPVNVADQSYFQEAVRTGDFSVGSFQVGRLSGKRAISFGYPVVDGSGKLRAVLTAALDLAWFNELVASADLPQHASVTFIDNDGTILSRFPDPEKWVGHSVPETGVMKAVQLNGQGVTEAVGVDGIRKVYGFRPLGRYPHQGGFVYVGLPKEPVLAKAQQMLSHNLLIVGIATVLGLVAVWGFGYLFVMRGVRALVLVSRQLAAGNLEARVGLSPVGGEIGELATAFDEMAESLQARETERKLANDRLVAEKNFSDTIIESLPGTFYLLDKSGRLLRWNKSFEKVTGYSAAEISEMRPPDFFPDDTKRAIEEGFKRVFEKGEALLATQYFSKDGVKTPYLLTGKLVELAGESCLVGMGLNISERKRIERERKLLFDLSIDMLCIGGFDGYLKQVNPAWGKTLGWDEEELLRRPVIEFIHAEDRESTLAALGQLKAGRAAISVENRVKCKDGSYRWISWNAFPFVEDELAFAVARDITEKRLSETKLKEAQALLLAAIEHTPAGILIADARDSLIRHANSAALEIRGDTGLPISDIPFAAHQANWNLFHPDGTPFEPEQFPLLQAVLFGKVLRNVEIVVRRPMAEERWILSNAAPVRNDKGEITAGVVVFTDVTELKKAENELRKSEEKYRRILETITDGYHEVDLKGNLILVNDSLCEIMGYSREELLGMNFRRLMDKKNSALVLQAYNNVFANGEANPGVDYEITRSDGSIRSVSASISPILDGDGIIKGFRGILRDVTQARHMEEQLRQSAKMEAIGRLAGGVAHDFNNILTAMMGYAAMLALQFPDNGPAQDKLNQIGRAGERAADLTRQLLAFSRKQMLDVRVLNLNAVITELEKMLKRLIGEDIELTAKLDPAMGQVRADPIQMEQILINLAVNARDAMPNGGSLSIETVNTFLAEDYARLRIDVEAGPYVAVIVSDSGCGMEPETLKSIFDPFFTTKELGVGTGLGLSTVYGIVKQHRGHVTVYSELGRGTTFKLYFPRVEQDVHQDCKELCVGSRPRGAETVLVVEDEEIVRKLACEALEMLGYTALPAADPTEAQAVSSEHEGPIHLLFTDVVLPQTDGRSLFNILAPSRPRMKVLYVSGYTENFIFHRGVLDHGVHFMQKPFDMDTLARKVRDALDEC